MKQHETINAILNQILALQKDGYTDFSFKTGREKNDEGELEECIVVDMTLSEEIKKKKSNKSPETKTLNFFNAKE